MKKLLSITITSGLMIATNLIITHFLNLKFMDLAFITGLIFVIIIGYFSFSGGKQSKLLDFEVEAITQIKMDFDKSGFHPSVALYTSIIYTLFFFIISLIFYREPFVILRNVFHLIGL